MRITPLKPSVFFSAKILSGYMMTLFSIGVLAIAGSIGGPTSLLALLCGPFEPLVSSGALFTVVKLLPSYWLVQAGKSALGGPMYGPLKLES